MPVTVYGMQSCDTVKKGTDHLDASQVAYERVDFPKADNLGEKLASWVEKAGLTNVLNTRALVFKKLDNAEQERLKSDAQAAVKAMVENPFLIKRPLLVSGESVVPGFEAATWDEAVAANK